MILTVAVMLMLSCYILGCEIQSPLPCYVRFGYVYFSFPNSAHVSRDDKRSLVFKTTNVNNNHTAHYASLKTKEYEFDFRLWDVEDVSDGAEYTLSLFHNNTEKVFWDYGNKTFKLNQDLFYCYYHKTPGDRNPRVFDITSTNMGMQWNINFWDAKYSFIEYHEVSAEDNGVEVYRERIREEICHAKLCSSTIGGLKPCREYKMCVRTKFIKATCTAVECVMVKTPECVHSVPIKYIALASAGGIFLLLIVISLTVFQRQQKNDKMEVADGEVEEIIQPRDYHHYYEIPYAAVGNNYRQIHHILQ